MRRRIGMVWVLIVVSLALMLPATTAAGTSYRYAVLRDNCVLSGGDMGYGYVRLRVRAEEWGTSGTNYFKARIRLQYQGIGDSGWTTQYTQVRVSTTFPNDPDNYYAVLNHRYDFNADEAVNYYNRIVMRIQWWDKRPGADLLLATETVTSQAC